MQLHQLKAIHKAKKHKRVGRGGKKGTYSGRGLKGQRARAGRKLKPWIREFIKRYPKLRGYRERSKARRGTAASLVLNLEILEKKFDVGQIITPEVLLEKRIIRRIKGRVPRVKILGRGEITKSFIVEKCFLSKQAKEKIEKAGGAVK